jgi:hypothetical protein
MQVPTNKKLPAISKEDCCVHCGKQGHKEAKCWKKMRETRKKIEKTKAKQNTSNSVNQKPSQKTRKKTKKQKRKEKLRNIELSLAGLNKLNFPTTTDMLSDPNIWIGDTGATCDSTAFKEDMVNVQAPHASDNITYGQGEGVKPQSIGDIAGTVCDKEGNELGHVKLNKVKYLPEANFNLFSITRRLKEGWRLNGDDTAIWIYKGDKTIKFDIVVKTKDSLIFCMYMNRRKSPDTAVVSTETKKTVKMSIKTAHERLGHCDEEKTRKIAKHLGWELTRGNLPPCEGCTEARANQKIIPKDSDHGKAKEINGRIFLDISTIRDPEDMKVTVTKRNWRIMVDELTGMKFSDFFDTKNGMIEPTCEQFHKWEQRDIPVKQVRCDNAGENIKLEKRCASADWKLGINFEYTGKATPQRNHLAELAFTVLLGRARAMMQLANVPKETKYRLYKEAIKTATLLDGLVVSEINGKLGTRYEHWSGKNPQFINHLRTWGEAGTVKIKTDTTPKLGNRGTQCMFVGYATKSGGDVYRMWNPHTNRLMITRDIIWLKRMYFAPEVPSVLTEVANPERIKVDGAIIEAREESSKAQSTSKLPATVKVKYTDDSGKENITNIDTTESTENSAGETELTPSGERIINKIDTTVRTRSGRESKAPERLGYAGVQLTGPEQYYYQRQGTNMNYYSILAEATEQEFQRGEIAVVGAGLGGGFENTQE